MLKNKLSRAQYMRRVGRNKKLSKRQKEGLWKGYAKRTRQAVKPRGKARTYGKGKFKALRARIGPKRRWTHMYRTKSGKSVRHIPEWAELGYASFKDMIEKSSTARGARIYVRRKERLDERRAKAAKRTSARILRGKGVFTPNPRRRRPSATFTYEEWEKEMKANARRRKKTTKKKKRSARKKRPTAAQTRARKRNIKKAQAARKKRTTKRRKKRTTKRRTVKKATARRRTTKRRTTKRRTTKRRTTKKRTTKRRAKRNVRARTTARRRPAKRRAARRRPARRRYFRNQVATFKRDFARVLKVGLSVGAGFVVQKVATKLLSGTGILDQIPAVAQFKSSIAGLAVAVVGTLGAAKFVPGDAKMIGAGMGAGFLHTLLIDGLNAFDQPQLVSYLGDYTEAEGKAFGSYYEFSPHQVYPAVGEYYSVPNRGMGLFQEAAGMGQYMQAAAGMGQAMQAAAGMGQAQAPRLSQAAAGVGEYLIDNGQGIGEYEEVVPQYSAPEQIDEGISPDLTSAEQAMSVAEAQAGVGAYGDARVPLQSTVYPTGRPEAIPDMPGGSRAGTFAGNNGVFGPSH